LQTLEFAYTLRSKWLRGGQGEGGRGQRGKSARSRAQEVTTCPWEKVTDCQNTPCGPHRATDARARLQISAKNEGRRSRRDAKKKRRRRKIEIVDVKARRS